MTNYKLVISTFRFGYARLTLKEGSKVKSDHTKRFPAHDFLQETQTSGTNNKGDTSTFHDRQRNARGSHLAFQNEAKNIPSQDFVMSNIFCECEISTYNTLCSRLLTKVLALNRINVPGGHFFFFQNEAKNIPRQDFMVMNISCKFENASYNIFFVRMVTANKGGIWPHSLIQAYVCSKMYHFESFQQAYVILKTIAKVYKLDAATSSCTQPPKPFSIVSMQYSQH